MVRSRLEYYKPLKKASILPSKGAHFEKFAAALRAAKLLSIFLAALRAAQHGLYTSNLLPTPMHTMLHVTQQTTLHIILYMPYFMLHTILHNTLKTMKNVFDLHAI